MLMRLKHLSPYAIWMAAFFGMVIAIIVTAALTLPAVGTEPAHPPSTLTLPPTATPTTTVAQENGKAGATDWALDPKSDPDGIQGYAGAVSALPGTQVPLYISVRTPMTYMLSVWRIGWYGGAGGRQYFSKTGLVGQQQGTWSFHGGLVGCATCTLDPQTHLVAANWTSSFDLSVGADWPSGMYLIKLAGAAHAESYIPLVVRAAPSVKTAFLVSFPVNTYQAYNLWGGYNLYEHEENPQEFHGEERATKVSFDRPYFDIDQGAGDFLNWDIHSVRWLERSGLDVAYTTNTDIAETPANLLHHRAFIALGHDEYWTKSERVGLELARDSGVSLAFWGADDGDWQVRMEPDGQGKTDRTLVCYKVAAKGTGSAAPANDPAARTNRDTITSKWSDPLVNRPQSTLLGLGYRSILPQNTYPAWVVPNGSLDPLEADTGLMPGMAITGGLVGYEYDGLRPALPPGTLHVLAASPVKNYLGYADVAYTAYYIAPSGALVFDAGTIWWANGLDGGTVPGASKSNHLNGNAIIMKLNAKIVAAMLAASPRAPIA